MNDYIDKTLFKECESDRDYFVVGVSIIEGLLDEDGYDTIDQYFKAIKKLPRPLQVLQFSGLATQEINNGGFLEFISNIHEGLFQEVISSFREIGEVKQAKIMSKLLSYYRESCKKSDKIDDKFLYTYFSDKVIEQKLGNIQNQFYEENEDYESQVGKYLKKKIYLK